MSLRIEYRALPGPVVEKLAAQPGDPAIDGIGHRGRAIHQISQAFISNGDSRRRPRQAGGAVGVSGARGRPEARAKGIPRIGGRHDDEAIGALRDPIRLTIGQ